ncbi:MAG: twin-arginine translocase TatA/TatE family subunit [Deltaproteobacteria bacterium]|nr:MAG: twin-arginine translocase TatA/TatE family subunit [Deltaproteobacteria bacterium]
MFGMGMPEIVLILAIALIVLGPKKLPEIAHSLGKAMRVFRSATEDLKSVVTMDEEIDSVITPVDYNKYRASENPAADPGEKGGAAEPASNSSSGSNREDH